MGEVRTLAGVVLLLLAACGGEGGNEFAEVVVAEVGFARPESVLHDPDADIYLVANVAGPSDALDGNGFVSRVRPDGTVEALHWIDGLDAPKGMAISGPHLYVADVVRVRIFGRATGAPLGVVDVEGAEFLNDVAAGPDGDVFVSDSRADRIYRIAPDRSVSVFAASDAFDGVNGICFGARGDLFAVGGGKLWFVAEGAAPSGADIRHEGLDGVVRTRDGRWLVSSWRSRAVLDVAPSGGARVVLEHLESPADLGYDAVRHRLLVPLMKRDRVVLRSLADS